MFFSFFFFNVTATTEIYTLSLHDALPIFKAAVTDQTTHHRAVLLLHEGLVVLLVGPRSRHLDLLFSTPRHDYVIHKGTDRKSTRLNSSHQIISYAVFCLKKKKKAIIKLKQ